jgi:hypothetical protein
VEQRGSDKHSPRVDEAIEHDLQPLLQGRGGDARAEPHFEQEDVGNDIGTAPAAPHPDVRADRAPADDRLTHEELEARSLLARSLEPSVFPARPAELVENARGQHAPGEVIAWLERLPEGQYDHLEAVWEALGGRVEFRA